MGTLDPTVDTPYSRDETDDETKGRGLFECVAACLLVVMLCWFVGSDNRARVEQEAIKAGLVQYRDVDGTVIWTTKEIAAGSR